VIHANPDAQRSRLQLSQDRNDRIGMQPERIQDLAVGSLEGFEALAGEVERRAFGRVTLLETQSVVVVFGSNASVGGDGLERVDRVLFCRRLGQEEIGLVDRDAESVPKEDPVWLSDIVRTDRCLSDKTHGLRMKNPTTPPSMTFFSFSSQIFRCSSIVLALQNLATSFSTP
jgi:hypothetical protein